MLTLNQITLKRGTKLLLENVNLTLNPKQRVGLIGANGSGKSSLFALLLQNLQQDAGDFRLANHVRVAHLAQETPALEMPAHEYVLQGDVEYTKISEQLIIAEQAHDGMEISHLQEKLAEIDGYKSPAKAGELLHGLGFSTEEQQKPVKAFSGGWRMRLNLAKALMCRSDLLLLDEPTNHLDLDAIIWLEKFLLRYAGTLILISHDREFLDGICTHIIHLEHQQLSFYTGNYSDFERMRAEKLALQQATYIEQQQKREHLQQFVNRFRAKASKAKQAQSRLKMLDKMPVLAEVQADSPFQFEFKLPEKLPNPLLVIEHGEVQYEGQTKPVLQNVNLSIAAGERIGVLGRNGAGKSTLMKTLARELTLKHGEYHANVQLKIGYFAQHQLEQLNPDHSCIDHMRKLAPKEKAESLRTYLGSFGFIGDQALAKVAPFSGGEKARLVLALLVWQKPNLLLLDEPTNHFDIEMREALTLALQNYAGSLVIVSHDRFLLQATVDEYVLVDQGQVQPFAGDLQDYAKWLFDDKKASASAESKKEKPSATPVLTKEQQNAQSSQAKKIEKELEKLMIIRQKLDEQLADISIYHAVNKDLLLKTTQQKALIDKQITELEERWLSLQVGE